MELKKRILVAPLNWGLGHATRCIPIISALLTNNFTPVLASDGNALQLLKKEFPELETLELPSYHITYSKNGKNFKAKLIKESPKILKAIKEENKFVKKFIDNNRIDGIISDNRLGVYSKKVPTVVITHQLNVLSGNTSWFSSKIHQKIIKKFNQCWVPDVEFEPNLSGRLGHLVKRKINIRYIGPLTRFTKSDGALKYDLMVLLSGPEPQRTLLEEKLMTELKKFEGLVLFVRGVIEKEQHCIKEDNLTIFNFMESIELEISLNRSYMILSRSGYTTIMDLAKLEKKAFFIPTPGQFEQEYLAKRLDGLRLVPSCNQDDFKIEMLDSVRHYSGLHDFKYEVDFKDLFSLFQSEGKLAANT